MKIKIIIGSLVLLVLVLIPVIQSQSKKPMEKKKCLIAYFSHSGNTKIIAEMIAKETGGDLFEIKPVKDYPNDYQTVVDQAKIEVNSNYHPELKEYCKNIKDYDVVFIGSPNWWGTMAPPVATFLSKTNLSEKTIVPFITHEGSGLGRCVSDIKTLCPGLNILSGLAVRGSNVKEAGNDVSNWLRSNNIIE